MNKLDKVFFDFNNLIRKIFQGINNYVKREEPSNSDPTSQPSRMNDEPVIPFLESMRDFKIRTPTGNYGNGNAHFCRPRCGWYDNLEAHARRLGKADDDP